MAGGIHPGLLFDLFARLVINLLSRMMHEEASSKRNGRCSTIAEGSFVGRGGSSGGE